jgi:hypothetical protein
MERRMPRYRTIISELTQRRKAVRGRVEKAIIKSERLAGDTAYGSGANLNWLVNEAKIARRRMS